jgi:hypothetical protein
MTDIDQLTKWLRSLEEQLSNVPSTMSSRDSETAKLLLAEFPGIVMEYAHATHSQREEMRLAFSRFRLVLYHLSSFASAQSIALDEGDGNVALRNALLAESLLDKHTDWRDELLMLRDLKTNSEARDLPFPEYLDEAARCSSPETAEFLRSLLRT